MVRSKDVRILGAYMVPMKWPLGFGTLSIWRPFSLTVTVLNFEHDHSTISWFVWHCWSDGKTVWRYNLCQACPSEYYIGVNIVSCFSSPIYKNHDESYSSRIYTNYNFTNVDLMGLNTLGRLSIILTKETKFLTSTLHYCTYRTFFPDGSKFNPF